MDPKPAGLLLRRRIHRHGQQRIPSGKILSAVISSDRSAARGHLIEDAVFSPAGIDPISLRRHACHGRDPVCLQAGAVDQISAAKDARLSTVASPLRIPAGALRRHRKTGASVRSAPFVRACLRARPDTRYFRVQKEIHAVCPGVLRQGHAVEKWIGDRCIG